MTQKNYKTKIIGAIMLCVNAFLLYKPIHHFYIRSSGRLIFVNLPNWFLLAEFLLAVIGIAVSICLLKNKISILKAVLLQLLVMVLTIAINFSL